MGLCNAGFVPYSGEGFALLLPSTYNPSKEKEFPGTELRFAFSLLLSSCAGALQAF